MSCGEARALILQHLQGLVIQAQMPRVAGPQHALTVTAWDPCRTEFNAIVMTTVQLLHELLACWSLAIKVTLC